jgi:hypothetical protein
MTVITDKSEDATEQVFTTTGAICSSIWRFSLLKPDQTNPGVDWLTLACTAHETFNTESDVEGYKLACQPVGGFISKRRRVLLWMYIRSRCK